MAQDPAPRYPLGVRASLPILIALAPIPIACGDPSPPAGAPVLGVTRVRAFHSPDLRRWTADDEPLPEHAMSLGLHAVDGGFEVTFMDLSGGERGWFDRTLGAPEIGVLRRTAAGWQRSRRAVHDDQTPAPIDPQGMDGALWVVARDGVGGDPAAATSENRIRVGPPWRTALVGAGLTDPMPVQYGGETLLFLTESHQRVALYAGQPPARVRSWQGVTVPYARVVDDELWLVAQQPAGGSRLPVPVLARSEDGRAFSQFEPILPPGLVRVCTSPVVAPDPARGGWLLLCVEEQAPGGSPPRAGAAPHPEPM